MYSYRIELMMYIKKSENREFLDYFDERDENSFPCLVHVEAGNVPEVTL